MFAQEENLYNFTLAVYADKSGWFSVCVGVLYDPCCTSKKYHHVPSKHSRFEYYVLRIWNTERTFNEFLKPTDFTDSLELSLCSTQFIHHIAMHPTSFSFFEYSPPLALGLPLPHPPPLPFPQVTTVASWQMWKIRPWRLSFQFNVHLNGIFSRFFLRLSFFTSRRDRNQFLGRSRVAASVSPSFSPPPPLRPSYSSPVRIFHLARALSNTNLPY